MKKVIALLTAVVLCLSIFAGCGAKDVKLSEIMDEINTKNNLTLTQLSSVDDLNTYYSINASDVKQFAAELDENNNAPVEIVLVEAKDSTSADTIEKALTSRYNSIYSQYSSYSPDQLDMVKKCKVTKDGNFVTMIVASNAEDMVKLFQSKIK